MFDDCNLLDLGATGGHFTLFRHRQGSTCLAKRLDRDLADVAWKMTFPEALVESLPRFHLDHCPILSHCGGFSVSGVNRPFKFQAAWSMHEGYSAGSRSLE